MEKVERNDRLRILSQIAVPIPCNKDWNEMSGTDRSRYCDHCSHSVINLSALTKSEAAITILNTDPAALCIRYTSKSDGSIQFKDQPQRRGFFGISAAFFSAVLMTFGLVSAAQAVPSTSSQSVSPPNGDSAAPKKSNWQKTNNAETKAETNEGKIVMGSPVALPGTSLVIKSPNAIPTPVPGASPYPDQSSLASHSSQPEVVGRLAITEPKK